MASAPSARRSSSGDSYTSQTYQRFESEHEQYLALISASQANGEKTANQRLIEERARERALRAQDPAVFDPDPTGVPGPVDFEAVERIRGAQ